MRLRKLLLTCHITLSVGWLGVEAAQVALGSTGLLTGNAARMWAVHLVMELLGTALVPPLAVGSLLTGILLGLGTAWGLISHYWVLAKLILNLALIRIPWAATWVAAWRLSMSRPALAAP